MTKHAKLYLKAYGLAVCDFIASELSGKKATDFHHIDCKGMGGDPSKSKDRIENIIALTRKEHQFYGDKKQYMYMLYKRHYIHLEHNGVKFDKKFLMDKLLQYKPYSVTKSKILAL